MTSFRDIYGILHHKEVINGDPETSENGPLFTAFNVLFRPLDNESVERFYSTIRPRLTVSGRLKTTPVSTSLRYSHDNATGDLCALYHISKSKNPTIHNKDIAQFFIDEFRLFQKQHLHPRDLFFYIGIKYNVKILMHLSMFFNLVSCWQTYKVRNGNYIIKTDGKLIGIMKARSMGSKIWIKLLTIATMRKRKLNDGSIFRFRNWEQVALEYYKNKEHPNVRAIAFWKASP